MTTFPAFLCAGAMLGGLLALGASWSRGARAGRAPHLAVGGVPSVGICCMLRLGNRPLLGLIVAGLSGAAVAAALWRAERPGGPGASRLTASRQGAARLAAFPLAADLLGLAGIAGIVALLAPGGPGVELRSLLGGSWPRSSGGAGAMLGVAAACVCAAVLLARLPVEALSLRARWIAAGAAGSLLAALATWISAPGFAAGRPDPLTLALAAAACAMLSGGPLLALPVGLAAGLVVALVALAGVPAGLSVGALLLVALLARPADEAAA